MAGIKLEIETDGLEEMIAGLKALPQQIADEVEKAHVEDLKDVAALLANYPPQKPGTHYIRTGDLGLGWLRARPKVRRSGVGLNFDTSLANPVPYAGEVQGGRDDDPSQLREFEKRDWPTTDQALEETDDRARKRLEAAVQRGLDKFDRLGKR